MTANTIVFLAEIVGIPSFIFALLDIGMNGARYAEWAPWLLGLAAFCAIAGGFADGVAG